ncbi:MAG: 4-oxalocrotonate tautomerase family protein [Oscillospiraceae bacterium]|nr:4-oxalocrotonate tautomerase family protein [Oscillospiraceae bacterium]
MPHVAITMIPGRDNETKRALALKTQAFLVRELGIDPKFVSVSIQDIPKKDWAKSMEQFSDNIMFVKPGV